MYSVICSGTHFKSNLPDTAYNTWVLGTVEDHQHINNIHEKLNGSVEDNNGGQRQINYANHQVQNIPRCPHYYSVWGLTT